MAPASRKGCCCGKKGNNENAQNRQDKDKTSKMPAKAKGCNVERQRRMGKEKILGDKERRVRKLNTQQDGY